MKTAIIFVFVAFALLEAQGVEKRQAGFQFPGFNIGFGTPANSANSNANSNGDSSSGGSGGGTGNGSGPRPTSLGSIALALIQGAYNQLIQSTGQLNGAIQQAQQDGNPRAAEIMETAEEQAEIALNQLQAAKSQDMEKQAIAIETAAMLSSEISGRLQTARRNASPDLKSAVREVQNSFSATGLQIREQVLSVAAAGQKAAAQNLLLTDPNLEDDLGEAFGNSPQDPAPS